MRVWRYRIGRHCIGQRRIGQRCIGQHRIGRYCIVAAAVCLLLSTPALAPAQPRRQTFLQNAQRIEETRSGQQAEKPDGAAQAPDRPRREAARKARRAQINLVERLMQMSPEQRQHFLDENPRLRQLPPERQRRIRQLTQRLSQLSPEESELLLQRYRLFLDLPPERQIEARRVYRRWRLLPPDRRRELLREVEQLREAGPDARRERLQAKEFSSSYNQEEQRIVRVLTELFQEEP